MAIWKETNKPEVSVTPFESVRDNPPTTETAPAPARHSADSRASVIGTGLVIEGKIEGEGDVHIAGSFKGDEIGRAHV